MASKQLASINWLSGTVRALLDRVASLEAQLSSFPNASRDSPVRRSLCLSELLTGPQSGLNEHAPAFVPTSFAEAPLHGIDDIDISGPHETRAASKFGRFRPLKTSAGGPRRQLDDQHVSDTFLHGSGITKPASSAPSRAGDAGLTSSAPCRAGDAQARLASSAPSRAGDAHNEFSTHGAMRPDAPELVPPHPDVYPAEMDQCRTFPVRTNSVHSDGGDDDADNSKMMPAPDRSLIEPKFPPSPYQLFVREERPKAVGTLSEIAMELRSKWARFGHQDRARFDNIAGELKKQYDREMAEFRNSEGYRRRLAELSERGISAYPFLQ